jgi:hypothetical protein
VADRSPVAVERLFAPFETFVIVMNAGQSPVRQV